MSENAIVVSNPAYITPVTDVRTALQSYQAMKDFVRGVLKNNVDFGIIPGTDKPTLLKPGAEKLNRFFGIALKISNTERVEDWTGENHGGEPFFFYRYVYAAYRGDVLIAEAAGSCNSWEKKYRWRAADRVCPQCGKPAIFKSKPPKSGFYCWSKKGGCGAQFQENDKDIVGQNTGMVHNPDIADLVNTIDKMAQKRSIIAVTLLAVNGSEYFTQDIEDYIDAEFVPAQQNAPQSQPAHPQKPKQAPTSAQAMKNMGYDDVPEAPPMDAEFHAYTREDAAADAKPEPEPLDAEPIAQAELPAVLYVPDEPMAKLGKHNYPVRWCKLLSAYKRVNMFEVDGILQKLKLPQDTRPEHVIDAINEYLDEKG